MKRRYTLRQLWRSVAVDSVCTGWLIVHPQWRKRKPGQKTRKEAAQRLQDLIDAHLKRRKT